jgi:hypothetical protein
MEVMNKQGHWGLTILAAGISKLAVGDVDGDGQVEIITLRNKDEIGWLRPASGESGFIAQIEPHVGAALEDVDHDGRLELFISDANPTTKIFLCKMGGTLDRPWDVQVIDPAPTGGAHDILFADIDGDGQREMVCIAMYTPRPGLFIYKPTSDIYKPWKKHTVQDDVQTEGTDAADVDGDGVMELVCGPHLYHAPARGPYAGKWLRTHLAPGFREMCRARFIDITGNGLPDAVLCESEYPDGRLSWFENRNQADPGHPWVERNLAGDYNFAHTLQTWSDPRDKSANILIAEMSQGGWNAPYNWSARETIYSTKDHGKSWQEDIIHRGAGTHEAELVDYDQDGQLEIIGPKDNNPSYIQLWKKTDKPSWAPRFRHCFLDRDKPYTGTDILAADVDGDGRQEVVCGAWWYRNPSRNGDQGQAWERHTIPGVDQALNAYDIDGDGRLELIAIKGDPTKEGYYNRLTSDLYWLKAVDAANGTWEEHYIGKGGGAWPHATVIGPFLPGNRPALVAGYHGPGGERPELFEIPDDPSQPWLKRTLADIKYGEEMITGDLTGNGLVDIVAGPYWLENQGDGTFKPHRMTDQQQIARIRLADINGNGRQDVVFVVEDVDYTTREAAFVAVGWLENPGDPTRTPWKKHVIDLVRSPHSVEVADLDNDGEPEIIVGEHDPFKPYRSRSRLLVYKKADPQGRTWRRWVLDDRFEHHDGTKLIDLGGGRQGIISHGWAEGLYVHLWEPVC